MPLISRNDVDVVRLEASVLGGWITQLIDFDGHTLLFMRHWSYEAACEYLRIFKIEPPPKRMAA